MYAIRVVLAPSVQKIVTQAKADRDCQLYGMNGFTFPIAQREYCRLSMKAAEVLPSVGKFTKHLQVPNSHIGSRNPLLFTLNIKYGVNC